MGDTQEEEVEDTQEEEVEDTQEEDTGDTLGGDTLEVGAAVVPWTLWYYWSLFVSFYS